MATNLTKMTTNVNNIQALSDLPNRTDGLTPQGLKERFDKAGSDIKSFINNTLIGEVETNLNNSDSSITELNTNLSNLSNSLETLSNTVTTGLQKHIMTLKLEQNTTVNEGKKIPLNGIKSLGDKLSYDNNGIKIGAGVQKVLISANGSIQYTASAGQYCVLIKKNDQSIANDNYRGNSLKHNNTQVASSCVISPFLLEVEEGDVISLYKGGANCVVRPETWLTVEVVE